MKEIILLRHAKSSHEFNFEDRDRPLNKQGLERIKVIAQVSVSTFKNSDIVLSSSACRAVQTAIAMMRAIDINFSRLKIDERLYTFHHLEVLSFIRTIDNRLNKVVCVGHNPAFTTLIHTLGNRLITNLPTAGWARFIFDENQWQQITKGQVTIGLPSELL